MIGIPDAFSRRVFRRRPVNELTDIEMMEVWLTPSGIRWDHLPNSEMDSPFRLVRTATETDAVFTMELHSELSEALLAFVERNLPSPEERCALIDNKDQMILGWIDFHNPGELEVDEERYLWFGCAAIFRLLAIIGNPVDAAFWERIAKDRYE